MNKIDIKLSFDASHLQKELQMRIENEAKHTLISQINNLFGQRIGLDKDNNTIVVYGDGYKEIDNLIADRFLDDKFKQEMNTLFEENWKRIFEECMTKALQHKANAIAFAKTKEIKD